MVPSLWAWVRAFVPQEIFARLAKQRQVSKLAYLHVETSLSKRLRKLKAEIGTKRKATQIELLNKLFVALAVGQITLVQADVAPLQDTPKSC